MYNPQTEEDYSALKIKFDAYYNEILLPIVKENDKIRRKYNRYFWLLLGMSVIFYPTVLALLFYFDDTVSSGTILTISGIFIVILSGPMYLFKGEAKKNIMEKFADFFGTFKYEFEKHLSDETLKQSYLFDKYNSHEGDDYFEGKYQDVELTISEERLTDRKKDFKGNTINQKVFYGVCIYALFNKKFIGQTTVKKHSAIFKCSTLANMQEVNLEDIVFNKEFDVYSTDQVEARYLLTTAFMERILHLKELYGGSSVQLSFYDEKLLIAIDTRKDMFETSTFFKSNIDRTQIDIAFEQFYTVLSIVKLLKLNKHLGM